MGLCGVKFLRNLIFANCVAFPMIRENLDRSGLPVSRPPLFTVNPYNKSFIGQACSVKMELSCPLGIARYPRAIIHSKSM